MEKAPLSRKLLIMVKEQAFWKWLKWLSCILCWFETKGLSMGWKMEIDLFCL
jgi:hypothetical protein